MQNLVKISYPFLIALLISLLTVPKIIKLVQAKGLLDTPNERKSHTEATPTLGGMAIYLGFIISCLIFCKITASLIIILSSVSIVFLIGIIDDIHDLKAIYKYSFQFIAATIITASELRLQSLYGLFGIYELNITLQYLLSILFITGITNAINLLDGINGLVGGLFFINSLVLAYLFYKNNDLENLILSICLSGGLLGFLRYNFNKAKIFMGDTGSLVIGFLMTIMVLKYLNNSISATNNLPAVISLFILPVFDMLRLMIVRLSNKKSPFKADNNHVHHLLLKSGYDHLNVSLFLYLANGILIITSFYFLDDLLLNKAIIALISFCLILMELIVLNSLKYLKSKTPKSRNNYKLIQKNII